MTILLNALQDGGVQIPLGWMAIGFTALAGAVGTLFGLYVKATRELLQEKSDRLKDVQEHENMLRELRDEVMKHRGGSDGSNQE